MRLQVVSREDWDGVSENIHRVVFKEERPKNLSTISFALLVTDENDVAISYSTIIEIDKISAYMQHGGTFPNTAKIIVVKSYHLMMNYLKERYSRITTRIRNINYPMLKLAMSADLIIIGCEMILGDLFLTHAWIKPESLVSEA